MAMIVDFDDLPASVKTDELAQVLLDGANAKASRVAPCLVDTETPPSVDQIAEAKLVLLGAIKRWSEAGSGALQAETAGPFTHTIDTRQRSSGFNLWPSEITQLQDICSSGTDNSASAFSITPTAPCSLHLPWCSVNFGAYCSCGVDIAGYPIFEGADGY